MIPPTIARRLRCWTMQASLTSARWSDRLRGPAEVKHRVLLVSPPKAGTHLLGKALKLMPGIRSTYLHVERPILNRYTKGKTADSEWAIRFPEDEPAMRRLLARVGPGRFCTAHLGYHESIGTILDDLDYKVLLILRDPRDIAVSLVNYLKKQRYHPLHEYFRDLPFDQALVHAIEGLDRSVAGRALPSLCDRLGTYVAWTTQPRCYTLKFEELVGEKGGGSADDQRRVLESAARHLGLPHDEQTHQRIASRLFGGTATFHRGTTQQWRERYNEAHLQLAREHLSELLIQLGYESPA